ncbi:unnamed protein product [Rotaria magnacalcarata]|uniref:Reverse transcriptase domain-containing protein n=2 Tax=Rotaria magnacalcarata TaxID=392030 RepID=A0A817AAD8_9BILA|nr:unnamed protein product [Rotaria magnacalcarata]
MGISKADIKWIGVWLYNRRAVVEIAGKRSRWFPIKRGGPQGSCFTPILFITYHFDMEKFLCIAMSFFFADDLAAVIAAITDIRFTEQCIDLERRLNHFFALLEFYAILSVQPINYIKTQAMFSARAVSYPNPMPRISCRGILRLDTQTHLEDLSNEIFFEIFDYLHALDIFSAFASLNKRISSILRSISLCILISRNHCRNQIDFLSSHLTFHTHQVISIKIRGTIRDDSSIFSLLFSRQDFINLQFCRLTTIDRSTKLDNVIKQIKTFDILVSFNISNLNDETMNVDDKCELTRTMLMHQSSSLRLIVLQYTYDYSNVTSLHLYIDGSPSIVSVLSVIAILRLCHRVRYLHIMLKDNSPVDDTNI